MNGISLRVRIGLLSVSLFANLVATAAAQSCPEPVSWLPYSESKAVAKDGDYAYIGSNVALLVANVSTPSNPQVVGEVVLPNVVEGVAVSDGYAFVANGVTGLRIVDVRTPSAPIEVGSFDTQGYANGVEVNAGVA
jgi:hypothetical protein